MSKQNEKNNDRTAWTVSIVVHALLLIVFIFMVAWREPNPPLPEYGIQINFGTDDTGSGDVQPTEPANTSESEEEEDAPASDTEEIVEESTPEDALASDNTEEEDVAEPTTEEPTVEDIPTETITQEAPSPDVIEEEPEPEKEIEVKEEKVSEKPVEEDAPASDTEEVVEKEPVKTPVLYEKKETNTTDGTGEASAQAREANEGDDTDQIGDKGQEDGTPEGYQYEGKSGGGGGAPGLSMSGWMWDFIPKAKDTSDENGRIVFEVKIDADGEIISVRTIERSVSAAVEKVYRQEVEKLTFTKISGNQSTAPISTGKITFVIKSK